MAQPKKTEKVKENPDEKSKEFVNVILNTEERLQELKDPVFEVATTIIDTEDTLADFLRKMQEENPNIPDPPYRREGVDA